MATDIQNRTDIQRLVDTFYQRIRQHPELGHVFDTVAQVNWETHLPKMYNFWEHTLFGARTYKGNPMQPHLKLHQRFPLSEALFEQWLTLFKRTVDDLFAGPIAERAKARAEAIANMMVQRLYSHSPFNFTE